MVYLKYKLHFLPLYKGRNDLQIKYNFNFFNIIMNRYRIIIILLFLRIGFILLCLLRETIYSYLKNHFPLTFTNNLI